MNILQIQITSEVNGTSSVSVVVEFHDTEFQLTYSFEELGFASIEEVTVATARDAVAQQISTSASTLDKGVYVKADVLPVAVEVVP